MDHQNMLYPQVYFADDMDRVAEQKIIVLMDAPREGILDRDDPTMHLACCDRFENVVERFERVCLTPGPEDSLCGNFAICAVDSLECGFHACTGQFGSMDKLTNLCALSQIGIS